MFRFCCWFRRVKGVEVLLLVWWGNEEVDEKQLPSSLSLSLAAFLRWGGSGRTYQPSGVDGGGRQYGLKEAVWRYVSRVSGFMSSHFATSRGVRLFHPGTLEQRGGARTITSMTSYTCIERHGTAMYRTVPAPKLFMQWQGLPFAQSNGSVCISKR
jgi:hypothetical protein